MHPQLAPLVPSIGPPLLRIADRLAQSSHREGAITSDAVFVRGRGGRVVAHVRPRLQFGCGTAVRLLLVGGFRRTALVEYHAPDARRFLAPDRIEAADDLAVRIADQSGAERQRS